MILSSQANKLITDFSVKKPKLGDIKKCAKEIKKDHKLAWELWQIGGVSLRLLAILVFETKLLSQSVIEQLATDMLEHNAEERDQLSDWLLANQLMKNKKTIALMQTWENHPLTILRRLFWYHQARLRWTGQTPPNNSHELLQSIEKNLADAESSVQWAMNFCAGQIGVHQPEFRARCIKLGEELGLYKNEQVAKNCTPSYLPDFIRIEVSKRE